MNKHTPVIVVGAAAAGTATAMNLRRAGYGGPITLVGDETHRPYDRPPLSKGILLGTTDVPSLELASVEQLRDNDIDVRLGIRASGVDIDAHQLELSDGSAHTYQKLVIATGAAARTLRIGQGLRNVFTLRTLDDARGLKPYLRRGTRIGVVGGGLIGLEVGASARSLDVDVTVVEQNSTPLADRLTAPVASWLAEQHLERGVSLQLGVAVERFDSDAGIATSMVLTDGRTIPVDVVLVAVGSIPNVSWLESSGVPITDGVVCDEFQRAATDVYAIGDVARTHHRALGKSLRQENRSNATEAAAHVARHIMGDERSYEPVPFFWTDQYDFKIQAFGIVDGAEEFEFVSGSVQEERWILTARRDGRLTAVVARDRGRALMEWRKKLQEEYKSE